MSDINRQDLLKLLQSYIGMKPNDVSWQHWGDMQQKLADEILRLQSKEKDIPKREWDVLEIESHGSERRRLINGLYRVFKDGVGFDLDYLLNRYDAKIISVKRLSDNSMWTTGEQDDIGIIHSFYIECGQMWVRHSNLGTYALSEIQKVKPKEILFTTEDGKDIFDGDIYFSLSKDFQRTGRNNGIGWYNPQSGEKYFSTDAERDKYILQNKPIQVSFSELNNFINRFPENFMKLIAIEKFFKSKINP
jgi:hypothetical protein